VEGRGKEGRGKKRERGERGKGRDRRVKERERRERGKGKGMGWCPHMTCLHDALDCSIMHFCTEYDRELLLGIEREG